MKILIRNLSRKTTEADLWDLFKAHGIVKSCDLVIDKESGKSKGFGFVEMAERQDAKEAIKILDGTKVAGSKVRVKKVKLKKSDTDSLS
jgi:RNA recognition motif-containing protein